ncbi:MAG TPA: hypothetical protein VNU28_06270, partial [Solirubrobacteraceae bacterium]|nr:hypothetical protein [Solirubrobacteraceae bacterium]
SIFIASPVLTHWKEREGIYRNRRARIVRDLGYVPAYATSIGEAPIDVEPVGKTRRGRRALSPVGEDPGEQLSKEEFDELVREIGPELAEQQSGRAARHSALSTRPAGVASRRERAAKATTKTGPREQVNGAEQLGGGEEEPVPRDPTADLNPEDLVMKDPPKQPKSRRPRNRRHGRSR